MIPPTIVQFGLEFDLGRTSVPTKPGGTVPLWFHVIELPVGFGYYGTYNNNSKFPSATDMINEAAISETRLESKYT